MRTKIIITKTWTLIEEYDFPLVMNVGNRVKFDGALYVVKDCYLDIESKTILICVSRPV